MEETWKDVPGYEGLYQVSDLGRVRSMSNDKTKKGRLLKFTLNNEYYNVSLYKAKKLKTMRVHKLVAMAFLGHVPDGLNTVVDHIKNKLDNRLVNLRLRDFIENSSDKVTKVSSKLIGAWYDKKREKWESRI